MGYEFPCVSIESSLLLPRLGYAGEHRCILGRMGAQSLTDVTRDRDERCSKKVLIAWCCHDRREAQSVQCSNAQSLPLGTQYRRALGALETGSVLVAPRITPTKARCIMAWRLIYHPANVTPSNGPANSFARQDCDSPNYTDDLGDAICKFFAKTTALLRTVAIAVPGRMPGKTGAPTCRGAAAGGAGAARHPITLSAIVQCTIVVLSILCDAV